MHSQRFKLPVVLTEHARLKMAERNMDEALILDVIDTGTVKEAGGLHYGFISTLPTVQTTCYASQQ